MKPGLFLGGFVLGAIIFYHHGFAQGDLARRLRDVDMMATTVADEMTRHFRAENYWEDQAWDCQAVLTQHQLTMPKKAPKD